MTTHKIFSQSWITAWQQDINQNPVYQKEGKSWNGPLILKFSGADGDFSGFFLDLRNGNCHELRQLQPSDTADTILAAPKQLWITIIQEKKDPLFNIMSGKIKLEKGSMIKLAGQRKAAAALLDSASVITAVSGVVEEKPDLSLVEEKNPPATPAFTTTGRGLDFDAFPMQLFQKAKKLGIWDPAEIDFSQDAKDWAGFSDLEKTVLLHLTSQFVAGEEAVTLDLLPLIQTIAAEGHLEEEIFLTSFLWEEAKHTEFFALFFKNVVRERVDMVKFHTQAYRKLFYEELHEALHRLKSSPTPENQLKASITYNLIVEGTLAETGYEAYYNMLTEQQLLPGLRKGIGLLKKDESRHIAFGLYFIKRLLNANPDLFGIFESETNRLSGFALDVVIEIFDSYEEMPFGLDRNWYIEFALSQFQKRIARLSDPNDSLT